MIFPIAMLLKHAA